jgi:acid phosphatase type 7
MIRNFVGFLFLVTIISVINGCDGETEAEYYNNMTDPPLKLIRQPYLQNNLADSITIAWKTTNAAKSCFIEYGFDTGKMMKANGIIERQRINTMNYVTLKGLIPDKKYHYKIYTNDTLLDDDEGNFFYSSNTFKDSFSFFTVADAGQPPSWNGHSDETAERIIELEKLPNFGLGLGDIVYPEGESEKADAYFFKPFQQIFNHVPFFTIPGNHDHKSKLSKNFKEEWISPGNEQYYSFDFGNAHFIGLDSGDDFGFTDCDTQMEWFENDLQNAQCKYDWIIVFLHHHGKTCSYKGDENDVLRIYPNLAKYNVDLVLNGHIHTYERLMPMDSLGYALPQYKYNEFVYPEIKDGFISVTAGTTGRVSSSASQEDLTSCSDELVVRAINKLSFVYIQVEKRKLMFELISSETNKVLDHFMIDKSL